MRHLYFCPLQADGVGMFGVGFGEISDLRELDSYSSVPTSDYEILVRSESEMGEVPGLMLYNLKRRKNFFYLLLFIFLFLKTNKNKTKLFCLLIGPYSRQTATLMFRPEFFY